MAMTTARTIGKYFWREKSSVAELKFVVAAFDEMEVAVGVAEAAGSESTIVTASRSRMMRCRCG